MQNKLKMVLSSILLPQHPDQATIFQELMTMVHDLRTLNTLHTEKFLQQCKITGQGSGLHRNQITDDHHPMRLLNINQHHPMWEIDRESAGNGSPQSSDTHSSSSSIEDSVSRRSPIGSVSSTESIGPSEIQKLTAQDLRVNGSVLMNALTAPASSNAAATLITAAGGITISRKRVYSTNEDAIIAVQQQQQQQQQQQHQAAVVGALFKARKLDSPIDSGIDSPRGAQGSSHSTNTSVCSSPRSSVEDDNKMAGVKESDEELQRKESPDRYEERHPLLKRALQQPPQIYNPANGAGASGGSSGPVSNFQDEVYKPHKKFRRNTSGSNNDDSPSSTQTGPASPPPASCRPTTNLLASQLAEPPQYLVQQQQRYQSSSGGTSLLASTLSRVTTTISTEECRRNEILANLILEGNPAERFSGLPRCMTSSGSDSYLRQQLQQPSKASAASPGLLMCAAGSPPPSAGSSSAWWRSSPPGVLASALTVTNPSATLPRHIPVPQPPTRPSGLHLPLASPSKEKLTANGLVGSNGRSASQPVDQNPAASVSSSAAAAAS